MEISETHHHRLRFKIKPCSFGSNGSIKRWKDLKRYCESGDHTNIGSALAQYCVVESKPSGIPFFAQPDPDIIMDVVPSSGPDGGLKDGKWTYGELDDMIQTFVTFAETDYNILGVIGVIEMSILQVEPPESNRPKAARGRKPRTQETQEPIYCKSSIS